jgi:serine protease AprX
MSIISRLLPCALASAGAALLVLSASPLASAANPTRTPEARIAPGLQKEMRDSTPDRQLPVIVQMKATPSTRRAASDDGKEALTLVAQHGRGGKPLGLIRGASGALSPKEIENLSHDARVAAIYPDLPVRRSGGDNLVTAYPGEVGAPAIWDLGRTGRGVTVAVLDSGIAQDPDLTLPTNRILTAVNFADPLPVGQQDPGGHGTHVAGIIAGDGGKAGHQYVGVAPNANLVDVRVLDTFGSGTASSVIAGLQWVVAHKNDYGIRIVNMSLGAPTTQDFVHDPIAAAVEIAWLRGIVVVTAAGNSGAGVVDSPGIDPHVITVGAVDDMTTPWVGDDTVPIWSGWGVPLGSDVKPDIVAPGRRIVSLRVPGSTLDQLLPDRVVPTFNGASYFRLSGTSMAAGVVSGAIALLLEAHPALTPDQVKALLTTTGRSFGSQGGPAIAVPGATNGIANPRGAMGGLTPVVAPRGLRIANAAAQMLYPLLYGQPLTWKDPAYAGIDWTQLNWTNLVWDDFAWDNLVWDNFAWDNLVWDNFAWDNLVWDASNWTNLVWDAGAGPTSPD